MAFIFVGLGAFFGACVRYGITRLSAALFDTMFPLGTLISNVLAGILIGFILRASQTKWHLSRNNELFLTTGLLGGLSTFSAFSMETVTLFRSGQTFHAVGSIALNVGLSIGGVVIGIWLADLVFANCQ